MKKLKFLFLIMVAVFISVPNVNASEISCSTSINLLKPNNFIEGLYSPYDSSPSDIGYVSYSYNGVIPVEPSTTYYYKHSFSTSYNPKRVAVVYYDKDFQYISYTNQRTTSNYHEHSFKTPDNAYYITFHLYNLNLQSLNSSQYQLQKDSNVIEFVDYIQCSPEEPDEPIIPDNTLGTFYSIFIDKITYFSNYCVENKFLLGTFGIVILFIVIEIILNLFRKGGY